MKKLLSVSILLMMISFVKAQDPMFLKDDKVVNLGFGVEPHPVLSASVDYGLVDGIAEVGSIGAGPYIGFGFGSGYTIAMGGVRGTFHYPFVEKLDTYVGFGLGFEYWKWKYFSNDFNLVPGFFVGGRYYLNDNFALFGEVGYGISYLNIGLAVKF